MIFVTKIGKKYGCHVMKFGEKNKMCDYPPKSLFNSVKYHIYHYFLKLANTPHGY